MSGIREQKKKETRQRIIETAVKLFGEKGYEKTSVAALAKAAGVGKGTIYNYFQSKGEIILAFCEGELEHVHQQLAVQTDPETPLLQQLVTLYMAEFRYVTKNPEFGRVLMREMIFPKDLTVERSQGIDNKFVELLTAMFKEAQQRGELRHDLPLFVVAAHFYGLYAITVSGWYMGRLHSEDDVEMALESLFSQALEGVANK